jgi:hypothetical protein
VRLFSLIKTSEKLQMTFKPGASGNPAGRPKRKAGKMAGLRAQVAKQLPDILENVITAALEGDLLAARILIDRVLPPLRAEDTAVSIDMPDDASPAVRADAILLAATAGKITPAQCNALMTAIGTQMRIYEADELERRIAKLEASNAKP